MLAAIIFSLITLIIVMPIRVFGASYASLDQKMLIQNFRFGLIEKNFGIKITEEGIEYFNLEKPSKGKENPLKVDVLSILDKIKIKKINITGCFGDENNAFNTAIICSALNITVPNILTFLNIKCKDMHTRIYPLYQKNILELHFKIKIKISVLLIIILFIRSLKSKKQTKEVY